MQWPVQDAKQRFSELLRQATDEGPQFVTRHGEEVAVVVDVAYFRELTGLDVEVDFKAALTGAAPLDDDASTVFDDVVAERPADLPRDVGLTGTT
nr:type II toxin-antitoxin system prevent-host-death family antitoxin [Haloactinopolyspora alba]